MSADIATDLLLVSTAVTRRPARQLRTVDTRLGTRHLLRHRPTEGTGPAPPAVVPASIDAASWPRIVEAAGLSGMVRQFALNCVPASFERDVLTLRLDEGVDARRSRAIEEKLLQALTKYLGRAIRLVFEVSQSELATPARQRALADQDKVVRATAAFEADPVVKGLQERFGAAVDTASVKPGN